MQKIREALEACKAKLVEFPMVTKTEAESGELTFNVEFGCNRELALIEEAMAELEQFCVTSHDIHNPD